MMDQKDVQENGLLVNEDGKNIEQQEEMTLVEKDMSENVSDNSDGMQCPSEAPEPNASTAMEKAVSPCGDEPTLTPSLISDPEETLLSVEDENPLKTTSEAIETNLDAEIMETETETETDTPEASSIQVSEDLSKNIDSDSDIQILNHDEENVRPKIKSLTKSTIIELKTIKEPTLQICAHCKKSEICRFISNGAPYCSEDCFEKFCVIQLTPLNELDRVCVHCRGTVSPSGFLSWETMDFCKIECLSQYQTVMGSICVSCKKSVPETSLGKYCVRFGQQVKQFCQSSCLEEHKAVLKVCTYCQENISDSSQGFVAMVGEKGQFKEFCTKTCMSKYEEQSGKVTPIVDSCAVCGQSKPVAVEVLGSEQQSHKLCSEPCLAAFKFVNDVSEGQCEQCKKYFAKTYANKMVLFLDNQPTTFCGKPCLNLFILANRRVMLCTMCRVKKYNFDMIKNPKMDSSVMFCSPACFIKFQHDPSVAKHCEQCRKLCIPGYRTFFDGVVHYYCKQKCAANVKPSIRSRVQATQNGQPVISKVVQQTILKPPEPKESRNKALLCKPLTHNKGTYCRPMSCVQETQTDGSLTPQLLIPVPVPIYVPAPLCMYSAPYPVPVPFPLPIPVPIFIPTTRNSSKGILKEIRKIQDKMPTDPFEAELLMMAEMVAGDKKPDVTDSESDADSNDATESAGAGGGASGNSAHGPDTFSPEAVDTSNAFGEDMLQMALKMATELDEPAVDMESVLTSSTITPSTQPTVDTKTLYGAVTTNVPEDPNQSLNALRGRKRTIRGGSRGGSSSQPSKRGRRSGGPETTLQNISNMGNIQQQDMSQAQRIEVEKPDAHMRLKYTYGVNAWRHWVVQKNVELEKAMLTNRKIKQFKPDLLQLTADELNFSLCLFVKEVKKPNASEYAPDTIYYLCLGIQQYLFENGRIDNIFTDSFYEKFTDCLDEVAKKFQVIYNDARYIVTRVEEEHLWESKQLGAHSPHVLLSTLMFFNTKHFNLVTVEEHMQLSFSHIMKHWKRNPNSPGVTKVPGSRNVLLRFYPPQSALEANSRKKKVYEQQENEENPLRCPVKLYEFYLSKCPESVKTRNDVFYLLPERSCVPDSPVWYSTMALGKEPLMKMLHRIKMVKEINVALLTS